MSRFWPGQQFGKNSGRLAYGLKGYLNHKNIFQLLEEILVWRDSVDSMNNIRMKNSMKGPYETMKDRLKNIEDHFDYQ